MGGGFISTAQGALASNNLLGIQHSYWVGVLCFMYLFFFAWSVSKTKPKQAITDFSTKGGPH
jgi:FHS family L-fucose permease-like MFS transporter